MSLPALTLSLGSVADAPDGPVKLLVSVDIIPTIPPKPDSEKRLAGNQRYIPLVKKDDETYGFAD